MFRLSRGAYTICTSASGQYNSVQNNGVWVYNTKTIANYSMIGSGVFLSRSYEYKATFVSSPGSEITRHKSTQTATFDGQTCTFVENQVFANGSLRTDDLNVTCV